MNQVRHTIDAKGKSLGRVASEVVRLLQEKDLPTFLPNNISNVSVVVLNIQKLRPFGKGAATKKITRHTGYPGGLRGKSVPELFKKNPAKVFRHAVEGMLPANKLRKRMLRRLVIHNDEE